LSASVDVVIVGAGCAGLTAAIEARAAGLNAIVIEAAARRGGRAYTDTDTFGVPVDYGCLWLHSASINPLRQLADSYGLAYERAGYHDLQLVTGNRLAAQQKLAEFEDYVERCWQHTLAAGERGEDVAIAAVVDRQHRWYPLFSAWCAALNGLEPEYCSTLDHYRFIETGEDWPLVSGYGALIAHHATRAGIAVSLNTPAETIRWHNRGAHIETPAGTLSAQAVIITVSNGVLAAGGIRFYPPLPLWKQEAFHAVPMGQANKIILQFPAGTLDVADSAYLHIDTGSSETLDFHLRPFGHDIAVAYVSGRFSESLERAGRLAMIDYARTQLSSVFGSRVNRAIGKTDATGWNSDPRIRGAYSMAGPGAAGQRAQLAQPIGERLFFAGEATSITAYGSAHGAYQSGAAAVQAVISQYFPDARKSAEQPAGPAQ
jgi:monoamine oxidase